MAVNNLHLRAHASDKDVGGSGSLPMSTWTHVCIAWRGNDGTSQTYVNGQALPATAMAPGKLCNCANCTCTATVTVGNDADNAGCVVNDLSQGFVGKSCSYERKKMGSLDIFSI